MSDVVWPIVVWLILMVLGLGYWRYYRAVDAQVRKRIEDQGLAFERVTPTRVGLAQWNELYGSSRYVRRRFYNVVVTEAGVTSKQVWMTENARLVRLT
jgi:hypothetical protein